MEKNTIISKHLEILDLEITGILKDIERGAIIAARQRLQNYKILIGCMLDELSPFKHTAHQHWKKFPEDIRDNVLKD